MPERRSTSVGYLTNFAARLFARSLDRRLVNASLGPMPVFYALMEREALPQKELARLAAVEQPTMANTLGRMERDGLLARESDPGDGRSTLLRLTALGRARAASSFAAADAVNALALEALEPQERPLFMAMLLRIVTRLEADR